MLPFCGYNMADYFGHWLRIGREGDASKLPKLFYVNWFRKDDDGGFLWPGFGDNSRVLEWIFRRCDGEADGRETPFGVVPTAESLDTEGLEISEQALDQLLSVDPDEVSSQLPQVREHLARFGDRLPAEIRSQLEALEERLGG
jgi:phosphoenolpyruvate carboxykinase (GTP)